MAGCAAEHHACKVGLEETGDTASTGGGKTQGVRNFLQVSGAGDSIVWVGYMVPLDVNGEYGIAYTHGVPETNHR